MGASGIAKLFSSGDLVAQNPIATALVFIFVALIIVLIEQGIHKVRHSKKVFNRIVYDHISDELQAVGCISLILTFSSEVVAQLNQIPFSDLFTWAEMVLTTTMMVVALNTAFTMRSQLYIRRGFGRLEDKGCPVAARSRLRPQYNDFIEMRDVFFSKLIDMYPNSPEVVSIRFHLYLRAATRPVIIRLITVDYLCWIFLVSFVCANSLRLYVLPGSLPFRSPDDYTAAEDRWNVLSFVTLMGYAPLLLYVLMRTRLRINFKAFIHHTRLEKEQRKRGINVMPMPSTVNFSEGGHLDDTELLDSNATSQLVPYPDSHQYLLFGSLRATMYCLKIPLLLLDLYVSLFTFGILYETYKTGSYGMWIVLPIAFLPVLLARMNSSYALMEVIMLSACGGKLNQKTTDRLMREHEEKKTRKGSVKVVEKNSRNFMEDDSGAESEGLMDETELN